MKTVFLIYFFYTLWYRFIGGYRFILNDPSATILLHAKKKQDFLMEMPFQLFNALIFYVFLSSICFNSRIFYMSFLGHFSKQYLLYYNFRVIEMFLLPRFNLNFWSGTEPPIELKKITNILYRSFHFCHSEVSI